jgi:hypothetical protein
MNTKRKEIEKSQLQILSFDHDTIWYIHLRIQNSHAVLYCNSADILKREAMVLGIAYWVDVE